MYIVLLLILGSCQSKCPCSFLLFILPFPHPLFLFLLFCSADFFGCRLCFWNIFLPPLELSGSDVTVEPVLLTPWHGWPVQSSFNFWRFNSVLFSIQLDHVAKFFAPGKLFLIVLFLSSFVFGALSNCSWFWLSELLFLDTDAHDWADQYRRRGYSAYSWQQGNLDLSRFSSFHPAPPFFMHLCTICSLFSWTLSFLVLDWILVLALQVLTHETHMLIRTKLGSSVQGLTPPRLDWNSRPQAATLSSL